MDMRCGYKIIVSMCHQNLWPAKQKFGDYNNEMECLPRREQSNACLAIFVNTRNSEGPSDDKQVIHVDIPQPVNLMNPTKKVAKLSFMVHWIHENLAWLMSVLGEAFCSFLR